MSELKEKLIESSPRSISIEGTEKILSQMKNSICKIYKCNGTGFFCKIPFKNDYLKALITNYHVIDKDYIKNNDIIKISLNDDKERRDIKGLDKRKKFFDENYDITIIEIKNSDNIKVNYLELDDNIFDDNSELYYEKNTTIYILHYPKMNKASVSYGMVKEIKDKDINHTCCTEHGSSGSPIMNLSNHKIIGIHKEASSKFNFNIGSFIKNPVNEFIQEEGKNKAGNNYININSNINKIHECEKNEFYNKNNQINLIYFTEKEGIFNIFGDEFVKKNKNNIDLIINGKKDNLIGTYKLKKGENNWLRI